jgi:hypothetical protein
MVLFYEIMQSLKILMTFSLKYVYVSKDLLFSTSKLLKFSLDFIFNFR